MYPMLRVPGVQPNDTWQLFNVSNYEYYRNKVRDLQNGVCPFCVIDPAVNVVLYENESWRLWKNIMAPRSGQECQLIIPSKRHMEHMSELTSQEWAELKVVTDWALIHLGIGDDGVWLVRTGDPSRNAKSVPHLHYNFQLPNGVDRVEVTIAKSAADLENKLPLLEAWEKMRLAQEEGVPDPLEVLTDDERVLVINKMRPPSTSK